MQRRLPILHAHSNPGPAGSPPPAAPPDADSPDPIALPAGGPLRDAHGRTIRDLRLSITDRCNFRCVYCMDPDHRYMPKRELLSAQEYARVVRILCGMGIRKLRLTGGEPLLYADLDELLERIQPLLPGGADDDDDDDDARAPVTDGTSVGRIRDVALTTNGSLLTEERALMLAAFGVHRITISLDSLRSERVRAITRSGSTLEQTLAAISAARLAGMEPVKINAVVLRGVNDDEIADFAGFARTHGVIVRFIEWMPLDSGRTWNASAVVTANEIVDRLSERHDLVERPRAEASETALSFDFADGAPGGIGIIASVTRPFCGACSRLRVTADGKVRPCLFSHEEWDLRPLLRGDCDDHAIAGFIARAVLRKQAGHGIGAEHFSPPERGMSAIGG